MNNPLFDLVGRQLLLRMGFTPQQIEASLKAMRVQKTAPKPPPAGSITPKGQTNLFTKSGKLRDFTKPNPLAPTLSPVANVNRAVLQPGPVRPPAPGQMELFGTNPTAKPTGKFTAPSVPQPGQGVSRFSKETQNWVRQNSAANRLKIAMRGNPLQLRGRAGAAATGILGMLGIPLNKEFALFNLATSNFGQSGENPDAAARRLGYKSALEQQQALALMEQGVSPTDIKNALLKGTPLKFDKTVTKQEIPVVTPSAVKQLLKEQPTPRVTTEPAPRMQRVPAAAARPPVEQAYGASGKDLYMSHKKNNPLMIRYFGKNYGSSKKA